MLPAPVIVLELPLIVTVPALAVIEPETERFPATVKDVVVLIVPLTVRSDNIIPVPLIVFAAPDIIVVPPATCVNWPGPDVNRFPAIVRLLFAAAVIVEAVMVRLLKLCVPVPLMDVLAPVIVIVLVAPVNVPSFTQLPAIL